ncbi:MAG: DUF983 domain-containing protein [Parasphingorhabdus sp.]|uniref:DUF983 domain-containing protein n=1 Tax=Parasphingorhabdus sp. TaxID=2709688 RepID=UPI003002D894
MAEYDTMVDRFYRDKNAKLEEHQEELTRPMPWQEWHLPQSGRQAIWRGMRNQCPSCGRTKFFPKLLKPIEHCSVCDQDWTHQQADDFPAYLAIILTGHIMAPIMIAIISKTDLPLWANMAIIISLAIILIGALLQPAKGAVIAVQWWMGMHDFVRPPKAIQEPYEGDEGDEGDEGIT